MARGDRDARLYMSRIKCWKYPEAGHVWDFNSPDPDWDGEGLKTGFTTGILRVLDVAPGELSTYYRWERWFVYPDGEIALPKGGTRLSTQRGFRSMVTSRKWTPANRDMLGYLALDIMGWQSQCEDHQTPKLHTDIIGWVQADIERRGDNG